VLFGIPVSLLFSWLATRDLRRETARLRRNSVVALFAIARKDWFTFTLNPDYTLDLEVSREAREEESAVIIDELEHVIASMRAEGFLPSGEDEEDEDEGR
jgi:hypothetical protein